MDSVNVDKLIVRVSMLIGLRFVVSKFGTEHIPPAAPAEIADKSECFLISGIKNLGFFILTNNYFRQK